MFPALGGGLLRIVGLYREAPSERVAFFTRQFENNVKKMSRLFLRLAAVIG